MSTTMTLPPTMNALAPQQRDRLMRSARKLGKVLGTTPQLVEGDSAFPSQPSSDMTERRAHRREGRFFAHSPSASLESFASPSQLPHSTASLSLKLVGAPQPLTGTGKSRQLPRPLVLCLQSVPLPARRASVSSATTATFSTFSTGHTSSASFAYAGEKPLPLSPLSATFTHNSHRNHNSFSNAHDAQPDALLRRKKMAKLARTLGENVPPELVFGPSSTLSTSRDTLSASPSSTSSSIVSTERKDLRAARGRSWSVDHAPPRPSVDTVRSIQTIQSTHSIQTTHSTASSGSSSSTLGRTLGETLGASMESLRRQLSKTPSASSASSSAFAPSSSASYGASSGNSASHDAREASREASREKSMERREMCGKRKEKGWSGEWNQGDMGDVVKGLRSLRG